MSKGWRVAVLGATGLVGDTMINVLEERDFPVSELYPLASSRSLGKSIRFKGKAYPVLDVETFDFSKADIGLSPLARKSRPSTRPSLPGPAASSSTTPRSSATRTTSRWWCPR